jgi:hypothetical protein
MDARRISADPLRKVTFSQFLGGLISHELGHSICGILEDDFRLSAISFSFKGNINPNIEVKAVSRSVTEPLDGRIFDIFDGFEFSGPNILKEVRVGAGKTVSELVAKINADAALANLLSASEFLNRGLEDVTMLDSLDGRKLLIGSTDAPLSWQVFDDDFVMHNRGGNDAFRAIQWRNQAIIRSGRRSGVDQLDLKSNFWRK